MFQFYQKSFHSSFPVSTRSLANVWIPHEPCYRKGIALSCRRFGLGAPGCLRRLGPLRHRGRDLPHVQGDADPPGGHHPGDIRRESRNLIVPTLQRGNDNVITLRRYHEQAQEGRTDEGIGPQAPKAGEKPQAPGEGSERENQIGENGEGREGFPKKIGKGNGAAVASLFPLSFLAAR